MERVLFFSISFSGVMTGRADLHGHISRNVQAIIETPCVSLSLSVCVCVCVSVCVCSFAIWNTMMGTSILSMPWGIKQVSLFFLSIFFPHCRLL